MMGLPGSGAYQPVPNGRRSGCPTIFVPWVASHSAHSKSWFRFPHASAWNYAKSSYLKHLRTRFGIDSCVGASRKTAGRRQTYNSTGPHSNFHFAPKSVAAEQRWILGGESDF